MKWLHFRDPVTGQTWMEPISEPRDEPKMSPELVAEGEHLAAKAAALTLEIKAAHERLTAGIAAKVAALAPTEEEWAKSLFADETEADDSDTLERPQEDAWTDFEGDHLTDGKGYAAAGVYRRCRAAFDAAWPQGREAAMTAALEAFKAKDA